MVPELNVEENIILSLLLDYKKPDKKYIDELLNILGLMERRHHLPNVGMSGTQLDKMVLIEAVTYSLIGFIAGCILGIALQKALITTLLSQYHITWKFPTIQIVLIFILILLVTVISVISPLKRIKAQGTSEVIG